nr:cystatin-related protein 1-like isoform X1 [Peromyscus maniculatus bairdii]XP_042132368.1 cystatin-related protein 1-like isoform X1 [Peromyscus maniculatus bairdii]XP_042132370.1 cystatin-related protein 1-like isoform X1 [Peromyscus maniculatus bairdii]
MGDIPDLEFGAQGYHWILNTQAILILLLNSSHARANDLDEVNRKYLIINWLPISEKDALDIANIAYNLHSEEANISKIISNKLLISYNIALGEVELRPTTCTRAESVLDECPFKTNLDRIQDNKNLIGYLKWSLREKTCSKFLSELSNCPFSEHPDHQKRVSCFFWIFNSPFNRNVNSITFKCQSI